MMILAVLLPIVVIVAATGVLSIYIKIQHPSPLVWGRIIPRVGPVRAHEVLEYNEKSEGAEANDSGLEREARQHQFKVNWGYLHSEAANTVLFQQALLFEKMKIDPRKRGLKYEPHEVMVLELLDEATRLRWIQVRCQVTLISRFKLGLSVKREVFVTLLAHYKELEEHVIALAGAEGDWLRGMLVERLGLMDWRVIEGGGSEPETA
jgi:hypothetical protein